MGKKMIAGLIASLTLATASAAHAAMGATATISSQQLSPSSYKYFVSLTNTGDQPISELWMGWLPGYDFFPTHLTAITAPTSWTGADTPETITFAGIASARYVTSTAALQPGHTLTGFTFTTPDAPAVIEGTSSFGGFPTDFSYVYSTVPETGSLSTLTPTVVPLPEPTSLLTLGVPAALMLRRRKK